MLKVTDVKKTFFKGTVNEKKAIRGISLTLNDGDFCTVIGSNGAGKSTLLNLIAGALIPDEGLIEIDGKDVTRMPEYKRAKYIGRVFQDPMKGTAAGMQLQENLMLADRRGLCHRLRWAFTPSREQYYQNLVARLGLGLENRMTARIGLFSGGQRQAVTLLMATMRRPEVLLLDEPTAALDPKTAETVLNLVNQIVTEQKLTTLMITHNMRDALRLGNRLIMMNDGKIIADYNAEQKKELTIDMLLRKFEEVTDDVSDRMMLGGK
ncbi:MAG: ATP-binding cassette domain-containing protein [Allisonella histaminiformans]|uniref:ABC transporter ATP-binding protein n=1 Tax=Allisonella histaminiformans TaxID=209880 RepID=UPI000D793B3E|nr:ATP-binding cassette domain-containing protein [Allisonella histaminiformans]MCI6003320.1 ATP-binding cassette domain-containing protein [Allisonella histaminiformans]MDY3957704.1 ATP-binding cassette domain-containing protein [Allisonella histaminiformans]MDY4540205.1 ATP-binding cassette domain-containing protein [Allisonella histaminiformans]PWL45067.1 MAG: ABC transporter ATP-binding protein [Veillonellaceae bacterium]